VIPIRAQLSLVTQDILAGRATPGKKSLTMSAGIMGTDGTSPARSAQYLECGKRPSIRIYPTAGAHLYSQVSEAVPLTVMDVFCTPLFTVKVRF